MTSWKTLKYFILFITVAGLVQCTKGKRDEDYVDTTILPETPVVYNASITLVDSTTLEKVTILKPWFSFNFSMTNSSPKEFTVIAITIIVTAYENSITSTKTTVVTASNLVNDPRAGGTQPYLFNLAVGATTTALQQATVYVGGLDKSESFLYDVEVEFSGWFGSPTAPEDRFSKTVYFATQ